MKNIELNEREIESLMGLLMVEKADLETLSLKYKKDSQDYKEIVEELDTIKGILIKLK